MGKQSYFFFEILQRFAVLKPPCESSGGLIVKSNQTDLGLDDSVTISLLYFVMYLVLYMKLEI